VWTLTGLSFSSNIFTNLPLVHTLNPDFLGQQLWLCFPPSSWMSSRETPELGLQQFPELAFASPLVRACPRARLPNSALDKFPNRPFSEVRAIDTSRFRAPACSWLHFFTESRFPNFAHSRIRGFTGSRLPTIVNSLLLKTCLENFVKLNVSRVTGFPEFPNTSPSGKRVDSDDPIPRILRKFSKKRHPRNVGGDTRRPGSRGRLNRGVFRGTTPPRSYK
jgi:hypothetical protein